MNTPLKTLAESEKRVAGSPVWKLRYATGDDLRLVAALQIGSRVMQGLELIGRARLGLRDSYTSFTLIYLPSNNRREAVRLSRIDWKPLTIHSNSHANTPPELIGDIDSSHHHPFDLNWSVKNGAPMKALPIAVEITPDYQSFTELLDGVGKLFRISNAGQAIPNPWPEDLPACQ